MDRVEILYPMFTMVSLSLIVTYRLFFINYFAVKRRDIRFSFYKLFTGDNVPDYIQAGRMHYQNMFQIPVLFYLLCMFLYFSNNVTSLDVFLAWVFVGFRFGHFLIRLLAYDRVMLRFRLFSGSVIILTIHWILAMLK